MGHLIGDYDAHHAYAKGVLDVKLNAVDPGQTATEFNGHRGHSAHDGTDAIVHLALLGTETPSGPLTDRDGIAPW